MTDRYERFEKLIQAGDTRTAENLLFNWIKDYPNDAYAWFLYGKSVKDPSQKRDCFKRALSLDPSINEAQELLNSIKSDTPVSSTADTSPKKRTPKTSPPFTADSTIKKSSRVSEKTKSKLFFAFYSVFHLIITILLGIGMLFVSSSFVPGLLKIDSSKDVIQRNWLSNSDPSELDQELRDLTEIFLNPAVLDYRIVENFKELNQYRNNIEPDSTESNAIEFTGVNFVSQLVGGTTLQRGDNGQPLVILMAVEFDDRRIPVVYYGPAGNFHYDDTLLIEGVYIAEASGIVAQRVERLAGTDTSQLGENTMIMLRVASVVFIWTLLCVSIFIWKLNRRRWWNEITTLPSSAGLAIIILQLAMLITGCKIDLSTTLRTDGTGITSILVHESRENVDFLRSAPGMSGYLSAVIREIRNSGALYEHYIEGDQEAFFIQRYFNNTGSGSGNSYPIEGSWISVQRYQEGNEEVMRFIAVVDTRMLYQNSGDLGSDVVSALRNQLNQIDMKYHLNAPGNYIYHNGDDETGQQISWQLQMNKINFLVAETRFPVENEKKFETYSLYIWIALGVMFAVSTALLIASIWIRPVRKH